MRITLAVAVACLTFGGLAGAGDATAAIRKQTDIPAQGLGPALTKLAKEFDFQVLYRTEIVSDLKSQPAVGALTSDEALGKVLSGTGLTYKYLDDKTVTIVAASGAGSAQSTTQNASSGSSDTGSSSKEAGKKSSQDFRLAQVDQGKGSSSSTVGEQTSTGLSEIVVTAEKREERLKDVPMSVTVLTGEQLVNSQSFRFEDYVGKVPGLMLANDGAVGTQLVIRGLTTSNDATNSSVATYIDETPYGAVGPYAGLLGVAPNLDTFDMARIEVLKGPQGTLYGANALGGLLKYVTNAPDLSRFDAKGVVGGSFVSSSSGTGYDAHGMVNMPLGDAAALRLVGYDNYYPGYIDDPSRGDKDTNNVRVIGGRASLLLQLHPDFSMRFSALYQDREWGDWPIVDVNSGTLTPIYGSLTQENWLISSPGDMKNQLYNVTMDWDAGFAKLLSTTSYAEFKTSYVLNETKYLGPVVSSIFAAPYGLAIDTIEPFHAFTQEIRLSSSGDKLFQWQLGGYFTNQGGNLFEPFFPIDATSRTVLNPDPLNLGQYSIRTSYREYAGFLDLDYHISPTFDVAAGGRYSKNEQTYHQVSTGIFGGGLEFGTNSSQGVFTYSGDARWHFTPTNMVYARIAEGFVPGGPNAVLPTQQNVPRSYSDSTTVNYEVGIKTTSLDQRLSLDVAAFYIDWRDIQLQSTVTGLGTFFVNGGTARSTGAEWNLTYVPLRGLTLNLNGGYTDARLTQDTPASVNGHAGDRLPASPLWQSSASADYRQPISSTYTGFAGADWRLTGGRYANFELAGQRQYMPSFSIFDLRGGVETQHWSLGLYVKNVGNKIAITYVTDETVVPGGPQAALVYQPRTIGATVTAKF